MKFGFLKMGLFGLLVFCFLLCLVGNASAFGRRGGCSSCGQASASAGGATASVDTGGQRRGFFARLHDRRQQRAAESQGVATASASAGGVSAACPCGPACPTGTCSPATGPTCADGKCQLPSATLQLPKPPAAILKLPELPKN